MYLCGGQSHVGGECCIVTSDVLIHVQPGKLMNNVIVWRHHPPFICKVGGNASLVNIYTHTC